MMGKDKSGYVTKKARKLNKYCKLENFTLKRGKKKTNYRKHVIRASIVRRK